MEEATENQRKEFEVGDMVRSPLLGVGVVTEVNDSDPTYPIKVEWTKDALYPRTHSVFTSQGHYYSNCTDSVSDIALLVAEDEDTVEEGKIKVDDAVNPSHYQVAGIPEAIEIMQGLMTKEQFEGFLWGNILKYAYRYGRKGDKKDTAGKIEWYAKKLKELEEGESE